MKKHATTVGDFQALYFDAWRTYFDLWRKGMEGFWKIYHPSPHRRGEDKHAQQPCADEGAQLARHYGRRCHDVNVEHI
ncbi:hypothetical protein RJ527_12700 [Thalassospiraceae bacterium LMO-SO8]|nr:hypothetical protein [Alphaproteobacteria bacterium LMO-S08]WND74899.1 hypothetical protein RJ527_12700 [Thalassospiraceae bacterium LMO-SO8]